jgi:hypothetical protein
MRFSMLAPMIVVLVGIGVASAEVKTPGPEMKGQDSAMGAKCAMAQKACPKMAEKNCGMEKGQMGEREEHENGQWGDREEGEREFAGCCPMNRPDHRWGVRAMAGMHTGPMFMVRKLVHLAFLVLLILNVLLTILVSLDMAKRAKFNGLWIPILLICGIPGTAIYALFRIGDNIADAKRS